jgi:hypothetical protein
MVNVLTARMSLPSPRLIPDIEAMILNMGTNFAPEHLVEAFERPRPKIQRIELRFRPYVKVRSLEELIVGSFTSKQHSKGLATTLHN